MTEQQIKNYLSANICLSDKWEMIHEKKDGFMYKNKTLGLSVIVSISIEQDSKYWLHVSFARNSRIPEYKDFKLIKKLFIGDSKMAIQVFPEQSNHVNIHIYCMHLWHCMDGNPVPDFSRGKGRI